MNSKESSDGARSSSDILEVCDAVNGEYIDDKLYGKISCCYRWVSFLGLAALHVMKHAA